MESDNWATEVARRYHEATKHTYESVRSSAHRLDFANWPHPFKEYPSLEPLPLPPGLERLLRFGAGTVRSRTLPGGRTYHFRTYSSAGGLYPVEVYVATADGLHHYHPLEQTLRRLRPEDVRGAAGVPAETVLFLTGILWRTAWKYQARGYRHLYWDAGTMLANLLALAEAAGLRPRLLTGFVDEELDRLLGIDGRFEATLALLALGECEPAPPPALEPLALEVAPLSRQEVRYPLAEELHAASRLRDAAEVERYRAGLPPQEGDAPAPVLAEPLEPVLRRRVSIRDFALEPVPHDELVDLLARALGPIPADVGRLVRAVVLANAVEGLESGVYDFEPPDRLELVRAEEPRRLRGLAGYLVLEQYLGARAAAVLFLMADLERALGALGNRGYRAAQLEAGIVAGRLQVGAVALGWGATCSTFYDDDVTRAVAPRRGDSPMLCVALGRR
ncbi:MAG TPA: SagB/ThcOx family dehydrogenase [Gaiellaceae bacterium]|nr:SagB/ThcOx family dehydrogenase [Gaiellaceae bacterium]